MYWCRSSDGSADASEEGLLGSHVAGEGDVPVQDISGFPASNMGRPCSAGKYGKGVVKFVGFHVITDEERVGVALENPVGKNNGTVKGTRYFICDEGHGILCPAKFVKLEEILIEAPAAYTPVEQPLEDTTDETNEQTDDVDFSALEALLGRNNSLLESLDEQEPSPIPAEENQPFVFTPPEPTSVMTVSIPKVDGRKIGLGIQSMPFGVYITGVAAKGLAKETGKLQIGMEILSVNGQSVDGLDKAGVIELVKGASVVVVLEVVPVRVVEIVKEADVKVGLSVEHSEHTGITIKKVLKSGLAAATGQLHVGDRILAINGQETVSLEKKACVDMMKADGKLLRITLPDRHASTATTATAALSSAAAVELHVEEEEVTVVASENASEHAAHIDPEPVNVPGATQVPMEDIAGFSVSDVGKRVQVLWTADASTCFVC